MFCFRSVECDSVIREESIMNFRPYNHLTDSIPRGSLVFAVVLTQGASYWMYASVMVGSRLPMVGRIGKQEWLKRSSYQKDKDLITKHTRTYCSQHKGCSWEITTGWERMHLRAVPSYCDNTMNNTKNNSLSIQRRMQTQMSMPFDTSSHLLWSYHRCSVGSHQHWEGKHFQTV